MMRKVGKLHGAGEIGSRMSHAKASPTPGKGRSVRFGLTAVGVFVIGLVMALTSCADGATTTLYGREGRYTVEATDGWSVCEPLNRTADGSMKNESERRYMIVLCESKSDFEEGIELDKYSSLVSEAFAGRYAAEQHESDDGAMVFSCTVDSVKVSYYIKTFEDEKTFYQLVFWTNASSFEKSLKDFRQICRSFRLLNET